MSASFTGSVFNGFTMASIFFPAPDLTRPLPKRQARLPKGNATGSKRSLSNITPSVRIFFLTRPAKSGSLWVVHAGSNKADRSRVDHGSIFRLQDNATHHWL